MLGLGLSLQKGISAFNAGRALVSSYIRRVTEAGGVLQNTACDAAAINELNQDRLLEPASWVLVPDGIKEDVVFAQKPTSGLGDLSFSRASDATYTDSTGVVRRSPYNLLQFSEQFDNAAWTKSGVTVTANQAISPDGYTNADLLTPTISDSSIRQSTIPASVSAYTFSVWLRSATGSNISTTIRVWRDSPFQNITNTAITVTSTWQRFTLNFTPIDLTSHTVAIGGSSTLSSGENLFAWGAQLVEGTSALDYFPTTNRQDVPRIDFRNADGTLSSCGRLLLEPQRTNLNKFSEQFNNAVYTNQNITVTANATTSPDGNANADKLVITGTGVTSVYQEIITTPSNTYTVSAFVKKAETQYANLGFIYSADIYAGMQVDLNDGSIKRTFATFYTSPTSSVTNYGNGWYRLTVTCVINTATAYPVILPSNTLWTSGEPRQNLTGNNTTGAFFYGLQAELGTYPTTYIPTTTAAVTRIADTASKTGVSSLIGQTEGTLFVDFNYYPGQNEGRLILVTESAIPLNNRLIINVNPSNNRVSVISRQNNTISNGSISESVATQISAGRNKVALGYQSGNSVLYINGVQVATNTDSFTFSVALNRLYTMTSEISFTANALGYENQAALFKTRLSNDQLEVLTSEGYGTYALLAQSLNCVLQ